MNYRKAVLLDAESATTPATKTIDLKGLDPISRLLVQMKATNNGATPTAHPAKMITKLEVVDGSDILWSLSGIECQALNFYQTGKPAVDIISYINDNQCVPMMAINFGRWLWDEDLAFDPARFKNPQLKITHNLALGGSAPDAATLDVVADLFDEKRISPAGWLMAKEYNTYTLVVSAVQTIEMPTDYIMRTLMIQSLTAGKMPHEQYNKIKLSENNGKKIPIDDSTSDLLKYILDEFGDYTEKIHARALTTDVTHYIAPTYQTKIAGIPVDSSAGYVSISASYGGSVALKAATACDVNLLARGLMPHGALAIPFGDLWEAGAWYDVTKLAKLDLIITAGSGASGTCQVVTEQLRRF
jgi:hypothetical protein